MYMQMIYAMYTYMCRIHLSCIYMCVYTHVQIYISPKHTHIHLSYMHLPIYIPDATSINISLFFANEHARYKNATYIFISCT